MMMVVEAAALGLWIKKGPALQAQAGGGQRRKKALTLGS